MKPNPRAMAGEVRRLVTEASAVDLPPGARESLAALLHHADQLEIACDIVDFDEKADDALRELTG